MPKPANDAKSTSIAPIEKAAEPPRPPPPFTVKSPVVAWTEPAGLIVVDQLGHRQSLRPRRPAHTATQDRLSEIAIGRGFGIQHDAAAQPERCAVPYPLSGVSRQRSEHRPPYVAQPRCHIQAEEAGGAINRHRPDDDRQHPGGNSRVCARRTIRLLPAPVLLGGRRECSRVPTAARPSLRAR